MSSSDDSSSSREGDTASRSEEKTILRRFASDLMSAFQLGYIFFLDLAAQHIGHLPVRGSLDLHNLSTPSASSLLQGFLLLPQPLVAVTRVL